MLEPQTIDITFTIYTENHFADCCKYIDSKLEQSSTSINNIEIFLAALLSYNSLDEINKHLKSKPVSKEITLSTENISLILNSLNIFNIENVSHTLFILLRRNPPELLFAPKMDFSGFLVDCNDYRFDSPTEQSPFDNKKKLINYVNRLKSSKNNEYLEDKYRLFIGGSDIELWSISVNDINDINFSSYFKERYSKDTYLLFWRTKFNKADTYRDMYHHHDTTHCMQLIHVAVLYNQNIKPLGIVKGQTFDIGDYSSFDTLQSITIGSKSRFLSRDIKNYLDILAKEKKSTPEQLIETMRNKNKTAITYIESIYSSGNIFEKCIIASALSSKSNCNRNRPRKHLSEGKLTLFPKINKAYSLVIFNKKLEIDTFFKFIYTNEQIKEEKLIEEIKFEQKTLFIRALSDYIGSTKIIENETPL